MESKPNLEILDCYNNSPYLSIKHSTYFQVYTDLFTKYKGKEITFVEIGILNGGSLFMWKNFFGEKVKIIGVDLNPDAKKWEEKGFEIHIGNQSDPKFWYNFFEKIGNVDIILDDGGHTYEQQIVTVNSCIPYINSGGLIVVEDVHTSYFKSFGYPSKYTFIEWAKTNIEIINSRFPNSPLPNKISNKFIYSITFFESIVCISIDQNKSVVSYPVKNNGISINAVDFRHNNSILNNINIYESKINNYLSKIIEITRYKYLTSFILNAIRYVYIKYELKKLKKYF